MHCVEGAIVCFAATQSKKRPCFCFCVRFSVFCDDAKKGVPILVDASADGGCGAAPSFVTATSQ